MLEIIKSVRICDTFNLTLLRSGEDRSEYCYELQFSNDKDTLDCIDYIGTLKAGLAEFKHYLYKVLIKKVN